jgi:hypothetical protein
MGVHAISAEAYLLFHQRKESDVPAAASQADLMTILEALQEFKLGKKLLKHLLSLKYACLGNRRIFSRLERVRLISRSDLSAALQELRQISQLPLADRTKLTAEEANLEFGVTWQRLDRAVKKKRIKKELLPRILSDGRIRLVPHFSRQRLEKLFPQNKPEKGDKGKQALKILADLIADTGYIARHDVVRKSLALDISMAVFRRAAKKLKLACTQVGFQDTSYWHRRGVKIPKARAHPRSLRKEAMDFLRKTLRGGDEVALPKLLKKSGLSYSVLFAVFSELGGESKRRGFQGTAYWRLPTSPPVAGPQTNGHDTNVDGGVVNIRISNSTVKYHDEGAQPRTGSKSGARPPNATGNGRPQTKLEQKLGTGKAVEFLDYLYGRSAFSPSRLVSAAAAAPKCHCDEGTVRRAGGKLKSLGLAEASRGAGSGYWLTEEGKRLVEKLRKDAFQPHS